MMMINLSHVNEYLRNIRRRKTKTIFERRDRVQVAYTPQKPTLSEQEKAIIHKRVKKESRYHWPKLLLGIITSAGIAYLAVSLVSSVFLGHWHFF